MRGATRGKKGSEGRKGEGRERGRARVTFSSTQKKE